MNYKYFFEGAYIQYGSGWGTFIRNHFFVSILVFWWVVVGNGATWDRFEPRTKI